MSWCFSFQIESINQSIHGQESHSLPPHLSSGDSPITQTTSSSSPSRQRTAAPRNTGVHQPHLPQTRILSNPRNPVWPRSSKRRCKVVRLLGPVRLRPQPGSRAGRRHRRSLRDGCSCGGGHSESLCRRRRKFGL